jgi:hypothetical protein
VKPGMYIGLLIGLALGIGAAIPMTLLFLKENFKTGQNYGRIDMGLEIVRMLSKFDLKRTENSKVVDYIGVKDQAIIVTQDSDGRYQACIY